METTGKLVARLLTVDEDLVLRQLEIGDYLDIFNAIDQQREYLGQWLPFVATTAVPEDTKTFVEATVSQTADRFEYVFTIRHKEQFIGLVGFKNTDKPNRRTEIGYWLSREWQGRGIVTRCVERLCRFAFDDLNMNRIQVRCAVGNEKSKAIPIRLGFQFEGIERDGELGARNRFRDIETYSKLKRD